MKLRKRLSRPHGLKEILEAPEREHPLHEVLAQPRIVETSFLFNRECGKSSEERVREQATAAANAARGRAVHGHARHSAAWRFAFQHVAAKILAHQVVEPLPGPRSYPV